MQHHPNPHPRHDSALGNVICLDLTLSDKTAHQIAAKVAGVSVRPGEARIPRHTQHGYLPSHTVLCSLRIDSKLLLCIFANASE